VSTQEFFALHRGIAEATNDAGFGLKLGTEERFEAHDRLKSPHSPRGRLVTLSSGCRATNIHLSRGNPCSRSGQ